jgi:hypothetical protein
MLALAGTLDGSAESELFRSEPPISYNHDEQLMSVLVQRELDAMVIGSRNQMALLKLFPQREQPLAIATPGDDQKQTSDAPTERQVLHVAWPAVDAHAVRHATAVRIAAEAINFFGPLHGGVVTQVDFSDVIVQKRQFTTAYPHINLERYDVYNTETSEPLLGAWRARRIQNQRRETRTNRMLDLVLLTLEVGQAVLPRLLR